MGGHIGLRLEQPSRKRFRPQPISISSGVGRRQCKDHWERLLPAYQSFCGKKGSSFAEKGAGPRFEPVTAVVSAMEWRLFGCCAFCPNLPRSGHRREVQVSFQLLFIFKRYPIWRALKKTIMGVAELSWGFCVIRDAVKRVREQLPLPFSQGSRKLSR